MSGLEVDRQAHVADEIDDLRVYLESESDERRIQAEIEDLTSYLSSLPDDVRLTPAFEPYHARLRELEDHLLALRLTHITSRYLLALVELALRPSERSRNEQNLAGQIERLREELEALERTARSQAEPESSRLQHALQVLDQARLLPQRAGEHPVDE